MSAPAVKLNANVDTTSALAFFSDVATAAWNVSGGVLSDACTMSFEEDFCDVLLPPARLCRLCIKLSFAKNAFPPMVMEEELLRFEKERGRLLVAKLPEREDDFNDDDFFDASAEEGVLVVVVIIVIIIVLVVVVSYSLLPFNFL